MTRLIWKKILLSIGVLFITTALVAQVFTVEVLPGVIVVEDDYAWMCFEPNQKGLFCTRVHKSKFCAVEGVATGVLKCVKPLIANDQREENK